MSWGSSDPDTGDDGGVRPGYSLSYSGNHHSSAVGVIVPPCQLGLVLQLLEEDGGGIAAHLHLLHLLLM